MKYFGFWIFISLMCVGVISLIEIHEEQKLQRTPEQIERLEKEEAEKTHAKADLEAKIKARDDELKQKSWEDVGFEEGFDKFIAEGYLKYFVFILLVIVLAIFVRYLS